MTTIKRRLVDLEKAVDPLTGPLVLIVSDGPPTADQVHRIGDAKRAGRAVVVLDAPDVGIL